MEYDPGQFEGLGVYSNSEIKTALRLGHIVCHPLIEEHINGSSIDVTLGEYYYRPVDERDGPAIFNPFCRSEVEAHFDGPHRALSHGEVAEALKIKPQENIPLDHPVILVKPGDAILGHTHEFIGIRPPGTSSMQARSTWGRIGVAACLDAGWGDPGYINRWTMEIYNMRLRNEIILPVGERIAQVVFYHTGKVEGEYSDLSGKYQAGPAADLTAIVASWRPDQMLPRAYKDQRRKPLPL